MHARVTAVAVVAAFGLVVGHVARETLVARAAAEYFVESTGPALASSDPSAKNLYLRRVVTMTERPRQAWLQVIAHDRLRVYVNGDMLAGGDRDGLPVAAILDLVPFLQPGSNVIGITARQSSVDVAPVVSVTGEYLLSAGPSTMIGADEQWRATTRYEQGWLTPEFPERQWAVASLVPVSMSSAVDIPPRAITSRGLGSWITPASGKGARAAVRREFEINGVPDRAWLRLTATAGYRLAINGALIDERDDYVGTDEAVRPVRRTYDVTRAIRRGSNVVAVMLTRAAGAPHLRTDLEIEHRDGRRTQVGTDGRWTSISPPPRDWLDSRVENASSWQACRVESGDVGVPPWAARHRHVPTTWRVRDVTRVAIEEIAFGVALGILAWLAAVRAQRSVGPAAFLAFLLPTLGLAAALLASYDPRVPYESVVHPFWLVVAILFIPLQWFAILRLRRFEQIGVGAALSRLRVRPETALLILLVVAGAGLRLDGVNGEPLQWDELEHYEYTIGFLQRGFPTRAVHPDLPLAYAHTSELMFVPAAVAALFFDDPRHIMRLPSMCFSVLSIVLVYGMGRRMFGTAAGVIAAAILALSPVSIAMSTFGRYFGQLQFFTLLVVYGLWLTVRGAGRVNRRALAVTSASFAAMYLTWEGAAFLAVGLVLASAVHRRRTLFTIAADPAVWIAAAAVGLVLVLQYSHVVLQQSQFLWYGTSLSDLRIRPMWDYPTFRPWFYIWESSWSLDALLPMTALVAAICLAARHPFRRPLRFLLLIHLTTCVFMASFVPAMAWRYTHHLVPLLVVIASAVLVAVARAVLRLVRRSAVGGTLAYARTAAGLIVVAVIGIGSALDLRELPRYRVEGVTPSQLKFPNIEGPSRYVRERLQAGDVVLATDPFHVKHFLIADGNGNNPLFFWPISTLQLSATLDDKRPLPLDRRDGTPAIINLTNLRDLFARHARIWYVVQPARHENQNLPEVSAFLRQHMDVVYEDFEAAVLLRDRSHRIARVRSNIEQQLAFGNRHRSNFPPEPRLPE